VQKYKYDMHRRANRAHWYDVRQFGDLDMARTIQRELEKQERETVEYAAAEEHAKGIKRVVE